MVVSASGPEQFPNKLPPQNLEAEQGVLGSIMLVNEVIDDVAESLQSRHFYSDRHQKIYSAILTLHESGIRGIDAVTLAEELDQRDQMNDIGGPAYLLELLEAVPNAANAKYYASIVRDRWIQRTLTYLCNEILKECYEGTRDTEEVLHSAEQRIFSLVEQRESVEKLGIAEILNDTFDRIQERMEKEGTISGVSSGFKDLDQLLNGFQSSELLILAARPSMGKTALVCNFAEAVASESKTGVLVFSLEQSKLELAERLLCIRAQINGHRLRAGDLDEAEHDSLMQAASELSEVPLFIDDQAGRTMAQISAIARRLKRRNGLGLIVIDYLQLIEIARHYPKIEEVELENPDALNDLLSRKHSYAIPLFLRTKDNRIKPLPANRNVAYEPGDVFVYMGEMEETGKNEM